MYSRARRPRPVGNGACEVELTKGAVALIDEADSDLVSVCNWSLKIGGGDSCIYAAARVPGCRRRRRMLMHRLILCFPLLHVDHINGNGLDNRRSNLRLASQQENSRNSRSAVGEIPLKGVYRRRGKYGSRIRLGGHRVSLGSFPTAIEAALAYDAAAVKHFGEFAATNESLWLLESFRLKSAS